MDSLTNPRTPSVSLADFSISTDKPIWFRCTAFGSSSVPDRSPRRSDDLVPVIIHPVRLCSRFRPKEMGAGFLPILQLNEQITL